MSGYSHILSAVASEVWAVQPEKLKAIIGFLELKAAGGTAGGGCAGKGPGCLCSRCGAFPGNGGSSWRFGCRAACVWSDHAARQYDGRHLGASRNLRPAAHAELSQGDGGSEREGCCHGLRFTRRHCHWVVPEFAAEILASRKQKPVIAISDCLMASAAYWLASACTEVWVSPSALTGSIGVYSAHEDRSAALEKAGVKVTLVSYGANKVQGNHTEPLSDAGRDDMQALVNYYGGMFDKAVAKGRKVKLDDVLCKVRCRQAVQCAESSIEWHGGSGRHAG